MQAIRQTSFGGPEVLKLVDIERPEPLGTEVLVRVHACGVNPDDCKTRAGRGFIRSLPLTVGWDVSGVVAAVGPGAARFRPGDEVFGMPWFPREAAAYAEYVTAPSRQLSHKPAALSHIEAAALPMAGLTAWQVLVETANVCPGQRVLITAAAGGVGHLAVQIAKSRGAYVIGTARAHKHDFVRSLGADEVIDYCQVDVATHVDGLDIVFDPAGGQGARDVLRAIKPGGQYLPFGLNDHEDVLATSANRGIRTTSVLVEPDRSGLEAIAELAETDRIRVEIEATLPLAEASKAHEISERGRTRGKIVLEV